MPYKDADQQREYQAKWRAQRRADYLADKCCAVCGSTDRLEVDHIDPALKISHNIWSWSLSRRTAELAKCQVLCHDHHMLKTLEQRPKTQHGSGQMYQAYKCRCVECRAWKSASDRKYRSKTA